MSKVSPDSLLDAPWSVGPGMLTRPPLEGGYSPMNDEDLTRMGALSKGVNSTPIDHPPIAQ